MAPLPRVVFQHFRQPQNEGLLRGPDAVGEVDGRREGSRLRLALRISGEAVAQARYVVTKDRSCVVGLSLLTARIEGLPLGEVEALTVETLAEAYGLGLEQHPMLLPAMEALEDALCALRGRPSPFRSEGALVCHCLHVRRGRIQRAIQRRRLRTVEQVSFWTRACTGCRSCRPDVQELLDDAHRV